MFEKYAIVVEKITKTFDGLTALDNVSFKIPSRVIAGLLGHNGAGKSTLIKIMSGLLKPDNGKIYMAGINVQDNPLIVRKKFFFLPENPSFYGDLSLEYNLEFFLRINGFKDARARAKNVLEELGLAERSKSRFKELSTGMKMRALIAFMIAKQSRYIVLDEPFAGLDVEAREYFKEILYDYKKKGCTILISTHLIADVEGILDYVVFIKKGRVTESGFLKDVISKYNVIEASLRPQEGICVKSVGRYLCLTQKGEGRRPSLTELYMFLGGGGYVL